jgi:choice-of-anchor A domain-containing protein
MQGTWLGSLYGKARTIWNLYEGVTLHLKIGISGALLAPKATIPYDSTVTMEGMTVVNSMSTQGEIHAPRLISLPCASPST